MRLLIALTFLLFASASGAAEKRINSVTGVNFKTVKALNNSAPVVRDKIIKANVLLWDDLPEVTDEEGNTYKPSTIRGTIQHHRIMGGTEWQTVIDIEGKRYKGKSKHESGDWTLTVEEVEE